MVILSGEVLQPPGRFNKVLKSCIYYCLVISEQHVNPLHILVLCTGNSCRSQMAEGYLRHFGSPRLQVVSAGVEAHGLHPLAVQVMREDGVDISNHTSDVIDKYLDKEFDYVITVCDNARERCPWFPARVRRLHHSFSDPAKVSGSDIEALAAFRQVRDEIKEFVLDFLKTELRI